MNTARISASSYSNTAPLVWSFLYGHNHGRVEIILDNAPARSAELLARDRVDAALVPVVAYQTIDRARLIPDVCVGARERVRSVCLVTRGENLDGVRSVALDTSSRTSVVLTKIIFREFLGFEPDWKDAEPDLDKMLAASDAALIIGDPALIIPDRTVTQNSPLRKFDLAELWRDYTGLGFVFAMWMTRQPICGIDFANVRDEGLLHIDEIAANYASDIGLDRTEMKRYLLKNISYSIDDSMRQGMQHFFELAAAHSLIPENKPLEFT
ncbi:MAG: menaquinone biosynthetic enzyme MqnA/MqnD family protein [Pyrinomonadaceae bacterium]